ncbi:MAG: phage holin family protein [Solirubrobacterales bacterium]|nr:phage holin family protein [Solirubrobacterales bacterium]MBV9421619.1 phage holin family protein [Solirubrobacterales bacterium]MBV9797997.1 phage holin family protein [Solirubrobacterales bacterium]
MAKIEDPSTQPSVTERDTATSDQPVAELVKQLSEQTSRLARQEVELAKAELAIKGKRVGIGAGMFGGAGIFGLYAAGALVAAAVLALATAVAAWLSALIVGVVLAAAAGALALQGKTKVQQATPPVPEQATESVKEDVQWAKQRAQEGRQ